MELCNVPAEVVAVLDNHDAQDCPIFVALPKLKLPRPHFQGVPSVSNPICVLESMPRIGRDLIRVSWIVFGSSR